MTSLTIPASITQFRETAPALQNKTYLNFGAQGVLGGETLAAITRSYQFVQEHGPVTAKMFGWLMEELRLTKSELASEFSCNLEEIALTQSTTDGCNIVLWGLPWQAGDELLITDCEHTGVMAAVNQLVKRHSLVLKILPVSKLSDDQLIASLPQYITPATRLFLFSHILWTDGRLLPVRELLNCCRAAGVLTLVDGAQSAGVLPVDLSDLAADFYAITGHKWFGAPEGTGALYVAAGAISKLEPTFVGWRSSKFDAMGNPTSWEVGATRYEVSTSSFPLLAAFRQALSVRRSHGSTTERHSLIIERAGQLLAGLSKTASIKILTGPKPACGLVSFSVQNLSNREICARLEANKIIVRTIPHPDCIRVSLQYFTTAEEVDNLLDNLNKIIIDLTKVSGAADV